MSTDQEDGSGAKDYEEFDDDAGFVLNDEGWENVLRWGVVLREHGYTLRDRHSIMDAAGFLVANGHSEHNVIETAILLVFLQDAGKKMLRMFPQT